MAQSALLTELFAGGGNMGALMRARDWSQTKLGGPEHWPNSLRVALRILLGSGYPMYIAWGKEFTQFYNDGYLPILGIKHPAALGRGTPDTFPEIWDFIGPMFNRVLSQGEATTLIDQSLFLDRNGYVEECYFTFSYSPIPHDNPSEVGGVFVTAIEVTNKIIDERRLRTLNDLAARTSEGRNDRQVCEFAGEVLRSNPCDLPFCLIYLKDDAQQLWRLQGISGTNVRASIAPEIIGYEQSSPWPLSDVESAKELPIIVGNLSALSADIPKGAWTVCPTRAALVPIAFPGQAAPVGCLVAGLNPHKEFDISYRRFLERVAGQISSSIADARAYEEERRRAESLAELDRAKTAFFSNVSHEFRTPLTLLLGPIEEALADTPDRDPKNKERLEAAHRNALRLLKLVNSLLDFSRIEAGRAQASYEPLDIASYTADLASGFRSLIEGAGLTYTVDCDHVDGPVFVDRDMWEKIVLNLLSNAFKFTLRGSISIRQRPVGSAVVLSVSDTGTGIPERELPNVFKRFHRIEGAKGRSFEGTGIGLALVQELVKLHGGTISVDSVEGEGTTFTVSVPVGSAHLPGEHLRSTNSSHRPTRQQLLYVEDANRWTDSPARIGQAQRAETIAGSGGAKVDGRPKILVADDNADMRDYIGRLLRDHYDLQFAGNGNEAVALATEHPPDLVLTDVMMPLADGFQLVQRLRAHPSTQAVPVLMLSARAGEEARIEGLQSGADDYLVKPFTATELLARVGTHLRMSRIRKQAEAQVHSERKRLSELFQHAPAFIAVLSGPDFVFELTNPPYQQLIGNRHVLGKPLREALPEVQDQGILDLLRRVRETGETYSAQDFRIHLARQAGQPMEERFLDFIYQPVRDGDNTVSSIIALGLDVTDKRRAQDALMRTEKLAAVGRLAASIAHEINNPLEAVTNLLYLIQNSPDKEDVKLYARMADQELRRVTQIATQTLRFHRQTTAPTETDMSKLLDSVLALYQARLANSGIKIERRFAEDFPVFCLEGEVRQVFSNLVANALDSMPFGGRLIARTRNVRNRDGRDTGVLVTIADTGTGMPEPVKRRVFEAFFTTKEVTGTGLGLWISKGIVSKHGGTIRMRSSQNPQSHGTVFQVFLPYEAIANSEFGAQQNAAAS